MVTFISVSWNFWSHLLFAGVVWHETALLSLFVYFFYGSRDRCIFSHQLMSLLILCQRLSYLITSRRENLAVCNSGILFLLVWWGGKCAFKCNYTNEMTSCIWVRGNSGCTFSQGRANVGTFESKGAFCEHLPQQWANKVIKQRNDSCLTGAQMLSGGSWVKMYAVLEKFQHGFEGLSRQVLRVPWVMTNVIMLPFTLF